MTDARIDLPTPVTATANPDPSTASMLIVLGRPTQTISDLELIAKGMETLPVPTSFEEAKTELTNALTHYNTAKSNNNITALSISTLKTAIRRAELYREAIFYSDDKANENTKINALIQAAYTAQNRDSSENAAYEFHHTTAAPRTSCSIPPSAQPASSPVIKIDPTALNIKNLKTVLGAEDPDVAAREQKQLRGKGMGPWQRSTNPCERITALLYCCFSSLWQAAATPVEKYEEIAEKEDLENPTINRSGTLTI